MFEAVCWCSSCIWGTWPGVVSGASSDFIILRLTFLFDSLFKLLDTSVTTHLLSSSDNAGCEQGSRRYVQSGFPISMCTSSHHAHTPSTHLGSSIKFSSSRLPRCSIPLSVAYEDIRRLTEPPFEHAADVLVKPCIRKDTRPLVNDQ